MDGTVTKNEVTESINRNNLKDIDDGAGSDKVDSGMDDDSQHSNEPQEQGDDSDNEDEIVIRKPNKKRALLLDDDDESSKDSVPVISEKKESKTASSSDSDDNSSGDENDKEEENSADRGPSTSSQGTSSGTLFGNTDLFDAESDSDKEDNSGDDRKSGDDSGSESNSDEADDEGFDENSIDPKLLKKLKQGAAKQSPKKSKRQAKKEEMLKLHGETQRIIRESSVRLPYHQPSPKSLNDFLARANKKQQEYKMLKGGVRDLQKAKALQEILTKTKIVSQNHNTSKTENDTESILELSKSKSETDKQSNITDCEMRDDDAHTGDVQTVSKCDSQGGDDDDDIDSLPDLLVEPSTTSNKSHDADGESAGSNKSLDTDKPTSVIIDNSPESGEIKHKENDRNDKTDNENTINLDAQEQENSAKSEQSVENKTRESNNSNDTFNSKTNDTCLENDKKESKIDNTQLSSSHSQPESMEVCDNETSSNHVKSSEPDEIVTSQTNMSRHLTPKLSELPELNALPRLTGGPDSFIDLDDEKEKSTPRNPGVSRLMDRLIKHSQKKKKKHGRDVDISIIQKKKVTTEKEELKMNTFTYHTEEDEENSLMKLEAPGAKLQALKVQLREKMKVKREEARQKRQEIFDLDNEEGYVDEDNAIEALDEEELSDRSDTDVEDEEFDEEFGDEEYELEEEEKKTNLFVDEEASEDDEDYVPGADNSEDEDEMSLRLHLSDEDEDDEEQGEEEDFKEKKVLSMKKRSRVLQISDDESSCSMSNSVVQEKSNTDGQVQKAEEEKENHNKEKDKDDNFMPFSKHLPTVSQTQNKPKLTSLSLPIEDSMDLYGTTDSVPSTAVESTQSLNFYVEDSQSQMLDADGFLKVGSAVKRPKKISAIAQLENNNTQDNMADFFGLCSGKFTSKESNSRSKTESAFGQMGNSNTQDSMDELLGLCSGRFADSQVNKEQSCHKSLFTQSKESNGKKKGVFDFDKTSNTQKNMDEFMGLCSGKFTTTDDSQTTTTKIQKSGVKRKSVFDEEDEESNDSFKLLSDGEEDKSDKDELSDNEDREEKNALSDDEDDNDDFDEVDGNTEMRQTDDEETEFRKPEKFKGFTIKNKHGKIRKDFVEDEAELSGSEYDSDENYDIAEDEDILEMEEGDKDVQMPESELRDQVGRVHLKQLIDEDKRELLRFQEMYLPDGDLHSEGGGRTRKFRWKDMDDDTQQDMFNDSDVEKEEEENENDYTWRKERFEREKWLQENQENEMIDEGSQFLKLGKVFFKRQNSEIQNQNVTLQQPKNTTDKKKDSSPTPKLFKLTAKQKRGSFLTRDKQTLAKIAETTKSDLKVNGAKNSKNFVFTIISPDKDKEIESESMPAPTERKVRKALQPTHKQPAAKRRKVEDDTSSQNSIFNHI